MNTVNSHNVQPKTDDAPDLETRSKRLSEKGKKYFKSLPVNKMKILLGLFIVLAILCVAVQIGVPMISVTIGRKIEEKINELMVLRPSSPRYETFIGNSSVERQVYLYNITNAKELMKKKGKNKHIKLKEMGPYVFKRSSSVLDPEFLNDGKSFAYTSYSHFDVDKEKSVGDPKLDKASQLNLLELAALRKLTGFMRKSAVSELIFTKTVFDFLFHFNDKKYASFNKIKVGYFKNEQDKKGKRIQMKTGLGDIKKLGLMEKYGGKTEVSGWENKEDNKLHGTDGSLFHPHILKDEILEVFSQGICRTLKFKFVKEEPAWNDNRITLYKFRAIEENYLQDPEKKHFCATERDIKDSCSVDGFVSLNPCMQPTEYSPLFMSQPNLYCAEKKYAELIEGLPKGTPDDASEIWVEPATGITMQAIKKYMINAYFTTVAENPYLTEFTGEYFIPILKVIEKAQASKEQLAKLYKNLAKGHSYRNSFNAAYLASIIIFVIALIIIILLIVGIWWTRVKNITDKVKSIEIKKPWKKRS